MRSLVLVADDPAIVRDVRIALRYAASCRVTATLDGRYAARAQLSKLRPDVVVVDQMCQRTNALARLREVGEAAPDAKAVLLSDAMEAALVEDALACGAHAVLSRRLHPSTLGTLLREVVEGTVVRLPPAARAQRPVTLARTIA